MLKSLQMGRGLAALSVAAFHLSIAFGDPRFGGDQVLEAYTHRGDMGVAFFFVLSGFIIALAHQRDIGKPARVGSYGIKRFIRLYPAYWVVTALILVGAGVTGGINHPPDQAGDILTVASLVRFTSYATPLGAAWTLFHEVFFYFLFALLILNRSLGLVAFAAWFLILCVAWQFPHHGDWSFMNVAVNGVNFNFFFGIAAYFLSGKVEKGGGIICLVGGALIFAGSIMAESGFGRSAPLELGYSLSFLFIIAGAVALERHGWVRELPVLGLIGDASYSLYLVHENVETTLVKMASKLGLMRMIDPRLVYGAVLLGTVAAAILFYKFVERPLLVGLRRLSGVRRSNPGAAMVAAEK